MRIVIINHTFQEERYYKRWQLFASDHKDIDVTLLAPESWTWGSGRDLTYGKSYEQCGNSIDLDNFHIKLFSVEQNKYLGWSSKSMMDLLERLNPDIIYYIGVHTNEALMQILRHKNKFDHAKVIAFSMRGHQHSVHFRYDSNPIQFIKHTGFYLLQKSRIAFLNRKCDAIFCHYNK